MAVVDIFLSVGRRRTFSDDFRLQVKQNNDLGTLKKSCKKTYLFIFIIFFLHFSMSNYFRLIFFYFYYFQVSSTLQVPASTTAAATAGAAVEKLSCNISNVVGYDSSLEDLNRELEKLCPLNEDIIGNVANSRYYCDIFSRQSIESGENSSPDLDDENRIRFVVDIPDSGCEIIVPKRPTPAIPVNATYQPCTNVQILKSSCSAFCDMKILQSTLTEETAAASSSSLTSTEVTEKNDDDKKDIASSLAH